MLDTMNNLVEVGVLRNGIPSSVIIPQHPYQRSWLPQQRAAGVPSLAAFDTLSTHSNQERAARNFPVFKPFHHKSKYDGQLRMMANRITDALQPQRSILYFPCGLYVDLVIFVEL